MKRKPVRTSTPRLGFGTIVATLLLFAAGVTGCSKVDDPHALPDGKHPIALSTTIGQAHTRTAAGGTDAQTIWAVGDRIGFFADGGYDNIPCTATATDGNGWSGLYWKSTASLTNIKAYYPYKEGGYKENGYDTFTILADQSTETNYYQSDVLKGTASETAFNNSVSLAFTHVMSKLSVELTTEDENVVSLEELRGATVQVTNMYTKLMDYGYGIYPSGNADFTLTLYNRSTDSGNARFQAIAVAGYYLYNNNKIIITSADGQRVYKGSFPESVTLAANKQHNYIFKVTKNLTVTVTPVSDGVGWEEGIITPGDPTEDAYTLYFPASRTDIKELKVNGDDVTGNSYQMKAGATEFTVTYQHADGGSIPLSARFLPGTGRYKLVRTYNTDTQTYTDTYKEVKSDFSVTWHKDISQVGDYLYADGTWSAHYATGKTCAGIVFHTGAGPDDEVSNYDGTSLSAIHGYAVAVKNSGSNLTWFPQYQGVTPPNTISDSQTAFNGYINTKAVTVADSYSTNNYPAIASCVGYSQSVNNSSGWYLPSAAQLVSFYNQRGAINESLSQVSGKEDVGDHYWSSTAESIGSKSFYSILFGIYRSVHGVNTCNIRPVITF